MTVRLDERQWAQVLAQAGGAREGARVPDAVSKRPNDAVYLLMLEGDAPNPEWTFFEKALDLAVQTVQPSPALTHVELFVPPRREGEEPHFGTYLGKEAGWGSDFGDSVDFYLNEARNGPSWRAIPVFAHGAVDRVRAVANDHSKTPYASVYRAFNYPFSCPPFRSLAWALNDERGTPAHCASLTARILRRALPEIELPHPSAWFGPSTLYLELSRRERVEADQIKLQEAATLRSLPEEEEEVTGADGLVRASDDAVSAMSDAECEAGVRLLTKKVVDAAVLGDPTMQRLAEKQLARGLLRWSLVQRLAKKYEN